MAIYHASVKAFSRSKGHTATAAAAYRAGIDIYDTGARKMHAFSRKKGVVAHFQMAPAGAPEWCSDPRVFWDAAQAWETRANARVGREVETSLPSELSAEEREALALDLGQAMVDRYKVVVLVAIHAPGKFSDARNHHVHLLLSPREVGPEGFGQRACAEFDGRGGAGADAIREVREIVANIINAHLRRAGAEAIVDHRRLAVQAAAAASRGDYARALELTRPPKARIDKTDFIADWRAKQAAVLGGAPATPGAMRDPEDALGPGRLLAVPAGHTHAAAAAERAREGTLRRAGPAPGARLRPGGYAQMATNAPVRIARARGAGSDVLNAQAEQVEDWLANLVETARQLIESLRGVHDSQSELCRDGLLALHGHRLARSAMPGLRTGSEQLVEAMQIYGAALRRPDQNRETLGRLQEEVRTAEREVREKGKSARHLRRAKEQLARAREMVMADALGRDQEVINQARSVLFGALERFNRLFPVPSPEAPAKRGPADFRVHGPRHDRAAPPRSPGARI